MLNEDLKKWLIENDVFLWINRSKLSTARLMAERSCNHKISGRVFKEMVAEHCGHYTKLRRLKSTAKVLLGKREWEKVNLFAEANLKVLTGKNIDYVVAYLRAFNIPANRSIVRGSSVLSPVIDDPGRALEEKLPSWLS